MKWVKLKRYCERSGDTQDAVQKKLARGIWLDGVQIKTAPDGARWVNEEAVDQWVERATHGDQGIKKRRRASASGSSDPARASKSTSASAECAAESVCTLI